MMDMEDQEKFLQDAKHVVKEQAYLMQQAIEANNMRETLKHASQMLSELRTSLLGPKMYYILYMQIFDELRVLEHHIKDEYKNGRKMTDLYESVQHAQNIIPRLYLLITVGSVFIETREVKATEILSDLLEMIKGVQTPLRGLFLRYYFLKMCKDKLPDVGNVYQEDGGELIDSINCILNNLSEMNKLWIRMAGNKENKPKREKERIDLKVTVGENLHRLSQLDGVNAQIYQETVLPRLLELIVNSHDQISQQYLIDCIIQTFPDEYHLQNLQILLKTVTQDLVPKVDVKTIFISLMDRLAEYATSQLENQNEDHHEEQQEQDIQTKPTIQFKQDIFKMFKNNIDNIITKQSESLDLKKLLDLQAAFLKFSLRCYPTQINYVDEILKSCVMICEKYPQGQEFDEESQKNIVKFLTIPLETISQTFSKLKGTGEAKSLEILQMNSYPKLMSYLPSSKRRQVANKICSAVISLQQNIEDIDIANQLLSFINPLLVNENDSSKVEEYEFEEEQQAVAKVLHLINCPSDYNKTIQILQLFSEKLLQGGIERLKYTIPSLVYEYIKVIKAIKKNNHEEKVDYLPYIQKVRELIDKIATVRPEISLTLYLDLTLCINEVDNSQQYDEFTYETLTKPMDIYQDDIGDADLKNQVLLQIIGTLSRIQCLSEENYDTLASNATQYSAKLLKKNDQCVAILKCCHLFYNQHYKNEKRVFECLKKCLKLADICLKQSISSLNLYVAILNKFFYFLSQQNTTIRVEDVQQCLDIIRQNIKTLYQDDNEQNKKTISYWQQTLEYITFKKEQNDEVYGVLNVQVQ